MSASDTEQRDDLQALIDNNRLWADQLEVSHPQLLERTAKQPKPKLLWLGCVDSRVPPEQILGLKPGDILVHRNIANQVRPDDTNAMSVIEFAVDVMGVEHIIVCGHDGCIGVATAIAEQPPAGQVGYWLETLRAHWLGDRDRQSESADDWCERNARLQALSVCRTDSIQRAWQGGRALQVHAWLYQLNSGHIRQLGSAGGLGEEHQLGASVDPDE